MPKRKPKAKAGAEPEAPFVPSPTTPITAKKLLTPVGARRQYQALIRKHRAAARAHEWRTYKDLRRLLQEYSNAVTAEMLKHLRPEIDAAGGRLVDPRGLRMRLKRLANEFRLKLDKAIEAAMRDAGAQAGTLHYDIFRKIYQGAVPKSIAGELAAILRPDANLRTLMVTLRAAEFRGGIALSTSIWRITDGTLPVLNHIITTGVRSGMSAVKLSKAVEAYLGPGAERPMWSGVRAERRLLTKAEHAKAAVRLKRGIRRSPMRLRDLISGAPVGPRTPKGTVSYNAFRLARTEINRSYRAMDVLRAQQLKRTGLTWINGIRWNLSASHPRLDICDDWANQDIDGLGAGVYKPENVPLDHPNGLCYTTHELKKPRDLRAQMEKLAAQGRLGPQRVARIRAAGASKNVPDLMRRTVTTIPKDTAFGAGLAEEFAPQPAKERAA